MTESLELATIDVQEHVSTVPAQHDFVSRDLTQAEVETLNFHLSNARSENTRKAYERQWKAFVGYCYREGFVPFPASVEVVCLYLSHLNSEGMKLSKIEQSLSAIKAVHHDQDVSSGVAFSHAHIKATLNSIRRTMAKDGRSAVKKPRSFNQHEVLMMVRSFGSSPADIQERSLVLLGMNAGLRASEFCALTVDDLVFDGLGVDITIRSSKTDQVGAGQKIFVGRLAPRQAELDAVKALEEWLVLRNRYSLEDTRNLFIAFRKGGTTVHRDTSGSVHGLTRESVTNLLVRVCHRAGIAETKQSVSSHGFRHTFITTAFSRHVDASRISRTSRHKNLSSLMAYDQTSRRESTVAPSLWS